MSELLPARRATVSRREADHDGPPLEFQLVAYRFTTLPEIGYEHRMFVFGGPVFAAVTAALSALGNWWRRREARRMAVPQWRTLGPVRVRVASERLLVWHAGAWWSVWLSAVVEAHLREQLHTLDLHFADDPPYRLCGVEVGRLAGLLGRPVRQHDLDAAPGRVVLAHRA